MEPISQIRALERDFHPPCFKCEVIMQLRAIICNSYYLTFSLKLQHFLLYGQEGEPDFAKTLLPKFEQEICNNFLNFSLGGAFSATFSQSCIGKTTCS